MWRKKRGEVGQKGHCQTRHKRSGSASKEFSRCAGLENKARPSIRRSRLEIGASIVPLQRLASPEKLYCRMPKSKRLGWKKTRVALWVPRKQMPVLPKRPKSKGRPLRRPRAEPPSRSPSIESRKYLGAG